MTQLQGQSTHNKFPRTGFHFTFLNFQFQGWCQPAESSFSFPKVLPSSLYQKEQEVLMKDTKPLNVQFHSNLFHCFSHPSYRGDFQFSLFKSSFRLSTKTNKFQNVLQKSTFIFLISSSWQCHNVVCFKVLPWHTSLIDFSPNVFYVSLVSQILEEWLFAAEVMPLVHRGVLEFVNNSIILAPPIFTLDLFAFLNRYKSQVRNKIAIVC